MKKSSKVTIIFTENSEKKAEDRKNNLINKHTKSNYELIESSVSKRKDEELIMIKLVFAK